MKRILLAVLFSFLGVVAAAGLAIGGMFLFGGFNEKIVYAEDLFFNEPEVISDNTFFLKLSTSTEGITQKRVRLYTSTGNNSSVINYPEYVNIGEVFPVVPKQVNGVNFGGNVTLYASYDGDSSNQIDPAKCEILIDIPVEKISEIKLSQTVVRPNQTLVLTEKDAELKDTISITPAKALIPYVNFGTKKVSNVLDKVIYLELTDTNGNEINKSVAQFSIDGVAQNSNVIKVNYRYDYTNRKILFNNGISIVTKNYQSQIKVNAYVYSTYEEQNKNLNSENVVQLVKSDMQAKSAGFAIGNYIINNFTFDNSQKEIAIDLTGDTSEESYVKLYVNNSNIAEKDFNLNIELSSSSSGIIVSDFYLYNMFLSINNQDFRRLCNGKYEEDVTEYGVRNSYSGISTEKEDWCWNIKIDNFLAYKNFIDNGDKFLATISYIEFEKDEDGNDTTEIRTRIDKTFFIVPTIIEVDEMTVVYNKEEDESFKVKSGTTLAITNLSGKNLVVVNNEDVTEKPSNVVLSPEGATFNDIVYYMSYGENYNGVSTVPNIVNTKYKVSFTFRFQDNSSGTTDNRKLFGGIMKYDNGDWGNITNTVLSQGTYSYASSNTNPDTVGFYPNEDIYVDVYLNLTAIPTNEYLFKIVLGTIENDIKANDVKFYEFSHKDTDTNEDVYSDIPYLRVNNIRYYIDYEPYFDSVTNTKFLKLIYNVDNYSDKQTENLFKVVGIGSFTITAQLCYINSQGDISWLNKSAKIKIDAYEDLEDLNVYKYTDEKYNGSFDSDVLRFNENASEENNFLFVDSSTMQTFKNYINYNRIEVYANQIFYQRVDGDYVYVDSKKVKLGNDFFNAHDGIRAINSGAITFGNWIAVYSAGEIVGYRISYSIGEVKTIKIDGIEYEPLFEIVMRALVNEEYVYARYILKDGESSTKISESLTFEVVDDVITNSSIRYGTASYTSSTNAMVIYADLNNDGDVIYKMADTNAIVNFETNLSYYFQYNESKAQTIETLTVETSLVNSGVNKEGLLEFNVVATESGAGQGGLTLHNFPFYEEGVLLALTLRSSTALDVNTYYLWNSLTQSFVLTQFDLTNSLYMKVYGLKISITPNDMEVYGKQGEDEYRTLLSDGSDSILKVTVKSYIPSASGTGTESDNKTVVSYSKILGVYFNTSNLEFGDDVSVITAKVDFVEDTDVLFRFYVGSNSNGNLIKVSVGDGLALSFVKNIKSPFKTEVATTSFEAPSSRQTLLTLTYADAKIDLTVHNVQMSATVKSLTLDSSYEIANPIVISNNRTTFATSSENYAIFLTLKSVPVDYSAVIKVQITLQVGEVNYVREKEITLQISNAFNNDDIKINPVSVHNEETDEDEDVDLDNDGYCNINAEQEYGYVKGQASSTIKLYGKFVELVDETNTWVDKIETISILFEDDDENVYPLAEKLMYDTSFNKDIKSFSIGSYELNVVKKIKISFRINFNDGGFVLIVKKVKVSPSIELRLVANSLMEGDELVLNRDNSYRFVHNGHEETFEISDKFDLEEGLAVYDTNSFEFDSNVFLPITGSYKYSVMVKTAVGSQTGGATACQGKTVIVFYYSVLDNNNNEKYKLKFEFDLNIFFIKRDADLTIGTQDGSSYYITAGEENAIDLNSGVLLSGRLQQLKDQISNVTVLFTGVNETTNEFVNTLLNTEIEFSEETEKLTKLKIYSYDYNKAYDVKMTFTFTFKNGQEVVIDKIVVVRPNISLDIVVQQAFDEGDQLNITQLNYVFLHNGVADVAYKSEIINNIAMKDEVGDNGYNENVFEYNSTDKILTVKTDAYDFCTDGKTKVTVYYTVVLDSVSYNMYFSFDVTINEPQEP